MLVEDTYGKVRIPSPGGSLKPPKSGSPKPERSKWKSNKPTTSGTTGVPETGYFANTDYQSVGQAYTPTYNPSNISETWQGLTDSQIAMANANMEKEKGTLDSQRSKAANDYRGLLNQASANHAMQQRAQRESMANMGMSGGGGTSRTLAQSAANNLNNQIGGIKLQEREYNEEVERALRDIQNQHSAQVQNITANNNVQMTSQQMQSDQWQADHNLAAAQYNSGLDQWNKQFGWEQENAKLNQLIELARIGKIAPDQFQAMTGIKF